MTRARSLSRLANTNAFTVDASNNVGIGSTQPDVRLDVNGDMNVTGTLTYEDVTNVETAGITTTGGLVVTGLGATIGGITTFFGDLNFGAAGVGGTITTLGHAEFVGVVTASSFSGPFSGDLSIEDKIVHTGDTNTAIRFPQADTFTVETGGTEAYRVDSSRRILLGHTSSRAIGHASGDGKLQIEGTNLGTSELSIVRNSDNNGAAHLFIGKSRGSSVGDSTVVQDDDSLGVIGFVGADGTDLQTRAAQITAVVDGTPGSNDMPGALLFSTTADGASSPTERFRIDSSGRLLISTTSSTSNIAGYGNGGIQLNSTTTAQACVNIIHRNNSNNTHAIVLAKARDGAANGGRVQDDDDFGAISFQGFDGTGGSSYRQGAEIRGAVDGTPGNTDMPGRLEFLTTPDGSATPTERLRITSAGIVTVTSGGSLAIPAVPGTNTNGDMSVLFQSTTGLIDGGSGLVYNPAEDALKVNGNTVSSQEFRGSGDDVKLTAANSSSTSFFFIDGGVPKIQMASDKAIQFSGSIGEIGNVTGFQATNTAASANTDFGIRATTIRFATGNSERCRVTDSGFMPDSNDARDLGSTSLRWANVFTADLQLSNESKKDTGGNDVDGTWGDYTIQEGENDLFLLNKRNGKKFKFMLQEVS